MVDMAVVAPLIHEAVVVGMIFEVEVVGLTFEAEEAVRVVALVAVANRGGELSTCDYLSDDLAELVSIQDFPIRRTCQHRCSFD